MRQTGAHRCHTHCHEHEYEFHYMAEGHCRFINDEQTFSLKERALTFSSPFIQHTLQNTHSAKHMSYFFVCFTIEPETKKIIAKLQRSFDRIGFLHMGLDFGSQLEQLLIKEQSPNPMMQRSAQHLFLSLLYDIMRLAEAPAMMEADMYATQLVQHMRNIVDQRLDLDHAADRLGISKAHLIRVFKSNMGMPPLRYFNRLKMDTARDLLRRTDMTLAHIAVQLSFCDEFYFSRVFKKYTGISPDGYRKGCKPVGR